MEGIIIAVLSLLGTLGGSYFANKRSSALIAYRLDKAAALIRGSDSSLVRIADAVGYRDYAQFSKMFKKYKGVSPSDYRRAHSK